ncbi:MAG TPA: hypothetical protein VF599_02055 [Pyrinomonadaceae bacterium]
MQATGKRAGFTKMKGERCCGGKRLASRRAILIAGGAAFKKRIVVEPF